MDTTSAKGNCKHSDDKASNSQKAKFYEDATHFHFLGQISQFDESL